MTRRPWQSPSTLLALLFVAVSCATSGAPPSEPQAQPDPASPPAASTASFLWLSDIHFTPFYPYTYKNERDQKQITAMLDQLVDRSHPSSPRWKDHTQWGAFFSRPGLQHDAYSARGHDSNDRLLQEVLSHAATVLPQPDFILITGDLLGHGFGYDYSHLAPAGMNNAGAYTTFVAETVKYIARSVRNSFAQPPVFAILGNNDAYCGDYDIHLDHPESDFLEDTASTFLRYFLPSLTAAEQAAFRATFRQGGYYTAALPKTPNAADNRLIVLNSIAFMDQYPSESGAGSFPATRTSCAASPVVDAAAQMQWLAAQAASADRAWIAAHVPPGTTCYSDSPFWATGHLDSYRQLFLEDGTASRLAGTLSAHSHMASFKLLRDGEGNAASFVLQAPSISPNHHNNATFGVLAYEPASLEIDSYQIHYLDLSQEQTGWGRFAFAGLQGPVTAAALASLYDDLSRKPAVWSNFVSDYGSRAGSGVVLGSLSQSHLDCLNSLQ